MGTNILSAPQDRSIGNIENEKTSTAADRNEIFGI
jgi:hypothetical protein